MLAFATVRTKVLDLEQQLLQRGLLKCADDIFYLTWDEIVELQRDPAYARLQARIRRRRLTHMRRNRMQPPLTINVDYRPPRRDAGVLVGQCASPGIAEGTVRLVLDPATDGEIKSGEILGCRTPILRGRRCSSARLQSSWRPAVIFRTQEPSRANSAFPASSTSQAS